MKFENKIVIITGAGSGIGAKCAERFAVLGATVIVTDFNHDHAKDVADQISQKGGHARHYFLDVRRYDHFEHIFHAVVKEFGRIDILVNNAGVMNKNRVKTAQHSIEDWDQLINVNQTGVFYGLKVALSIMEKQKSGCIVNIASLAGIKASGFNLAYSASKFAVVGMTKSSALEYGSKNIRINAVCPSYTETDMLTNALKDQPGFDEKILAVTPMKRFAKREEVVDAILFLASENASFITGQCLTLDGGLSL